MKNLTLHEKITLKGIFSGYTMEPKLDMERALNLCPRLFGKGVGQLPQFRKGRPVGGSFYHKSKGGYFAVPKAKNAYRG